MKNFCLLLATLTLFAVQILPAHANGNKRKKTCKSSLIEFTAQELVASKLTPEIAQLLSGISDKSKRKVRVVISGFLDADKNEFDGDMLYGFLLNDLRRTPVSRVIKESRNKKYFKLTVEGFKNDILEAAKMGIVLRVSLIEPTNAEISRARLAFKRARKFQRYFIQLSDSELLKNVVRDLKSAGMIVERVLPNLSIIYSLSDPSNPNMLTRDTRGIESIQKSPLKSVSAPVRRVSK